MRGFLLFLFIMCSGDASAQVLLKGAVQDNNGERLPMAHIFVYPDSITTSSDDQGRYSVSAKAGEKTVYISYVGFESLRLTFLLLSDTTFHMTLHPAVNQLNEVVISGDRDYQHENFESNRTSSHVLTQKDINSIPVLGGEADVIKTLQLLPGTVRGVEGTSDYFVRGGAADQNLVLLDGAPVYNTSHLFGFLSVFNPDILQKVEAVNGGFPAHYGGRLSSILDVETRSGISSTPRLSGDVGLIASRLYLEHPIVRDRASFWVAGRRTYIDQVVRAVGEDLPYFFYDINARVMIKPTKRDQINIGYYSGEDILDWYRDRNNDGDGFLTTFRSGNNTQSVQWRHVGDFSNVELDIFRTTYRYDIRNSFEENELAAFSDIADYGSRLRITRDSISSDATFRAGLDLTVHSISPNVVNSAGSVAEWFESNALNGRRAIELAGYAEYEWSAAEDVRINSGFRMSSGFVSGKQYFFPEPRVSVRFSLDENTAVKASYSRMAQYVHRISNSAVTSPTDIWYPVTDSVRPQSSHQVALAWQRRIPRSSLYISTEAYYKTMADLIGYEEGTNLFFNTDFESRLVQGVGRAWGLEFLVRKETGRFTGWISYTLSWSWRRFDAINNGEWFRSRYDRRHNSALVLQYSLNSRWSASVVWEYISGARFTPVIGQYAFLAPSLSGVDLIPVYADINSVKLADSHRLDIGVKVRAKPGKKFQWSWFAGVYNAYNRTSPIGINIEQDETDGSLRYEQPGLFGLLPFISYGFKL